MRPMVVETEETDESIKYDEVEKLEPIVVDRVERPSWLVEKLEPKVVDSVERAI